MNGKCGLACGLMLAILAVGCSSTKMIRTEIINNSDKTMKTPDWVLSSKAMDEENGNVIFLYKLNLDGSARPDACVSMARTQAVGEMMKYIKNSVTASGQVEELNASSDPSMSSLTAFLSQGHVSGAKVTNTYWEQTIESDKAGLMPPSKKLMCAAKVQIDKDILDKQMRDAINGTPGGNPEVRKKLIDAQKNFIENVGKETDVQEVSAPSEE